MIKTTHIISCDNWPHCNEEQEIESADSQGISDAGYTEDDDGNHFCPACSSKN